MLGFDPVQQPLSLKVCVGCLFYVIGFYDNLTGLIAGTIVLFAAAYILFQRREIRA